MSSSLLDVIRFGFLLEGSAAGSYGDGPQVGRIEFALVPRFVERGKEGQPMTAVQCT